MNTFSLLVLYGLDERSSALEVTSTVKLICNVTQALVAEGWRVLPLQVSHDLVTQLRRFDPAEWIVINLCEGEPQQDFYYSQAAHILEEMGFTYTGSSAWTLEETQYKWRMKTLLEVGDVPTPPWAVFERAEDVVFDHFPAIVKPGASHCSYGITRNSVVLNLEEAREQVARIINTFRQPAIIEKFLDSPEYNVAIWGNQCAELLGISTMQYDYFADIRDRLCTFEAKWVPESVAYQHIPVVCPAPISAELYEHIMEAALAAYRITGCRDYGRVDLRLDGDKPMVLDVNANCDISPEGGFAHTAAAAGIRYGEMLNRIVEFSLARSSRIQTRGYQNTIVEAV
ncbi:MAG: hypothetical protein ACK4WM_01490 [Thermoflexales bacterium]